MLQWLTISSQQVTKSEELFCFLSMVLILGQIDPFWEADTRLDASPGGFHHIHMMSLEASLYSLAISHPVIYDSLRPPWTVAHQAPLSTGLSRQEY